MIILVCRWFVSEPNIDLLSSLFGGFSKILKHGQLSLGRSQISCMIAGGDRRRGGCCTARLARNAAGLWRVSGQTGLLERWTVLDCVTPATHSIESRGDILFTDR